MRQLYLKNVVTLEYRPDLCIGCGLCVSVCPHLVFVLNSNKAQVIRRDACMECGACVRNCPVAALSVDAGVGCAAAIIKGMLNGTEANCC